MLISVNNLESMHNLSIYTLFYKKLMLISDQNEEKNKKASNPEKKVAEKSY